MQLAPLCGVVIHDPQFKEFRKFVNSLRCPLCDSQLDGNLHPKEAKLYCITNNDEYSGVWVPEDENPRHESIKYYYSQYEYVISVNRIGVDQYRTMINRYNRDVIQFYKNTTRKVIFDFTGDRLLFFRKRMEEDVFLNKLKLYNVFS